MDPIIDLLRPVIAFVLGVFVGASVMALMNMAKGADREIEETAGKEVDADIDLDYDIIRIVSDNKVEVIYNSEIFPTCLKLSDCEDIAGSDRILVIAENAFEGAVFRYGNHGFFWERIGTTGGYA